MIPDACGKEYGYERILVCFVENLITDCHSRSATVLGYVQAINKLFELRKFPIPADLSDRNNTISKIVQACERKENIAKQQSPLTKEMYVKMAKRAKASPQDSVHSVLFNFFNLIRVGGFRVSKYAQKLQTKVDEFEYGSGNKVEKGFYSFWLAILWCQWLPPNDTLVERPCASSKAIADYFLNSKEPQKWSKDYFCCRWQAPLYLSSPFSISYFPASKETWPIWWSADGRLPQPSRYLQVSHSL